MTDFVITYILMNIGEHFLPPMRSDFLRTLLAILIGFLFMILILGALVFILLLLIRLSR